MGAEWSEGDKTVLLLLLLLSDGVVIHGMHLDRLITYITALLSPPSSPNYLINKLFQYQVHHVERPRAWRFRRWTKVSERPGFGRVVACMVLLSVSRPRNYGLTSLHLSHIYSTRSHSNITFLDSSLQSSQHHNQSCRQGRGAAAAADDRLHRHRRLQHGRLLQYGRAGRQGRRRAFSFFKQQQQQRRQRQSVEGGCWEQ